MIDVESTGATVITTTTTGGESNSAKACAAKVPDYANIKANTNFLRRKRDWSMLHML